MIPSAARGHDWEHGFLQRTLALWDLTYLPLTNDREKKAGSGTGQLGGAIHYFDPDTNLTSAVDGVSNLDAHLSPIPFTAERLVEPDNFLLRFHTDRGHFKDGMWALRMIADHTNAAAERTMRSTHVIDQEGAQAWGALSDLFWITDKVATNSHEELNINGAGFLAQLYGFPHSVNRRGALALNVARNAGFVTDGTFIGPLAHILKFPGAGGGTQSAGRGRPAEQRELGLNADAGRSYTDGKVACWPTIDKAPTAVTDTGATEKKVFFYLGEPGTPDYGMGSDGKSNHTEIARSAWPRLAGFVKIDPSPYGGSSSHYDYSWHSNPPSTDDPNDDSESVAGGTAADGEGIPDNDGTNPDDSARPEGEPVASVDTTGLAEPCDHGHLPAESPAMSQRTNSFPYSLDHDIAAVLNDTKPVGYTGVTVTLSCRPSGAIAVGSKIELNVGIGASDMEGVGPQEFFYAAAQFDSTTDVTEWQDITLPFTGFDADVEQFLQIIVARRFSAFGATNSSEELHIRKTTVTVSA